MVGLHSTGLAQANNNYIVPEIVYSLLVRPLACMKKLSAGK